MAAIDYAPFSEVLPRARAVVHQGGVGTTGQGMRAGVPTLVVPHAFDQFDNAWRVARLGISRTRARKRYNAASAASELRALLRDESYAMRAAEVGVQVQREDGARAATDLIERALGG